MDPPAFRSNSKCSLNNRLGWSWMRVGLKESLNEMKLVFSLFSPEIRILSSFHRNSRNFSLSNAHVLSIPRIYSNFLIKCRTRTKDLVQVISPTGPILKTKLPPVYSFFLPSSHHCKNEILVKMNRLGLHTTLHSPQSRYLASCCN